MYKLRLYEDHEYLPVLRRDVSIMRETAPLLGILCNKVKLLVSRMGYILLSHWQKRTQVFPLALVFLYNVMVSSYY